MWREGRGACCYGDALFTSSLVSYFSVFVLNIFVSIFCLFFMSVVFFKEEGDYWAFAFDLILIY